MDDSLSSGSASNVASTLDSVKETFESIQFWPSRRRGSNDGEMKRFSLLNRRVIQFSPTEDRVKILFSQKNDRKETALTLENREEILLLLNR